MLQSGIRQALKQVELKREKLALEVEHLKNRPEIVKERRAIYDRLESTVREITRLEGVHGPNKRAA